MYNPIAGRNLGHHIRRNGDKTHPVFRPADSGVLQGLPVKHRHVDHLPNDRDQLIPPALGSSVACCSDLSEHTKRRPHDPHLNVPRLADGRKHVTAQVCPDAVAIDAMSSAAREMRP